MTPRWVSSSDDIKLDSLLVILIQISVVVLVVVVVVVVVFFWGGGGGVWCCFFCCCFFGGVVVLIFSVLYIHDHTFPGRPLEKRAYLKISSYFSTKTYVVGTQKNCLNETVLLNTQNICLNLY